MQKPYLNQYLSTTTSKIDRRLPAIYKVNNDVSLFLAVHWPASHTGLVVCGFSRLTSFAGLGATITIALEAQPSMAVKIAIEG